MPEKTIAEGTSIAQPVRLDEIVGALVRSGGGAVRVTEAEMKSAVVELADLGLYTEPTCAQAAAADKSLLASGEVQPEETTVIILTSTGVKATPSIAKLLGMEV